MFYFFLSVYQVIAYSFHPGFHYNSSGDDQQLLNGSDFELHPKSGVRYAYIDRVPYFYY